MRSSILIASCLLTTLAACAGQRATGAAAPAETDMPPARHVGMSTPTADPYRAPPPPPAHESHVSMGGAADVAIDRPAPDERPGLGTAWGESVYSPITTRPFQRASREPWATAVLHYNDEDGVRAHAAYAGGELAQLEAPIGDGSLGVSLVGDGGELLPGVHVGGRNLVVGADGERYRIMVRNATSARFEVVTSVDGLDVIDGKPASPARRGYLVDPGGVLVIDGFRQSDAEVAAFRFGKVAASYAARTSGDASVGVIGFAVFAERGAVWTPAELQRRDHADPFPARYATPPR